APMTVNVRVIAATNCDLERLVKDGRFREDLFYRLNVIRLIIPPLRNRRDEIPSLVQYFLRKATEEFGKDQIRIAEETMEYLLLYSWPGNVRQLQNEVRRLVALADSDSVLGPGELSPHIKNGISVEREHINRSQLTISIDQPLQTAVDRVEREM